MKFFSRKKAASSAEAPVIHNHFYLAPPPATHKLSSVANLAVDLLPVNVSQIFNDGLPGWHGPGSQLLNQGAALYDQLSSRLDGVLTSIDCGRYVGARNFAWGGADSDETSRPGKAKDKVSAAAPTFGKCLTKVDMYANSRLPPDLPPVRLYMDTYPLLCLAAKYADRVYEHPQGPERFCHIDADWRTGSKAMVIKSVPMDKANIIIFAIRGTATFMDWAVNLNMAPTSPGGFLDDPGNFCHAGFLAVARKMIRPVAARLRELLQEDPGRAAYSLLITGHSAGGAIATLLYSHMLASSHQARSELNSLASCFRRIHCITFGTPPVSLLPLEKPDRRSLRKSLFLTFINEGDPVARADKAYVRSLLELFANPVPEPPNGEQPAKPSKSNKSAKRTKPRQPRESKHNPAAGQVSGPVWQLPPSTLSNPGRLIVLRSGQPLQTGQHRHRVEDILGEGVVAQFTTDEQLRRIVWGDPVYHVMKLYAGRIETLAIGAVTVHHG